MPSMGEARGSILRWMRKESRRDLTAGASLSTRMGEGK